MKTPIYESSPSALIDLLTPQVGAAFTPSERNFAYWDCYAFNLVTASASGNSSGTGVGLYYTTCDQDIAFEPTGSNTLLTYYANMVRIDTDNSRAYSHLKVGLDVDNWQFVAYPRARDELSSAAYPDTIGSVPWLSACRAGALDGAIVYVDRAYFATPVNAVSGLPITPVGVLRVFAGRVAEVEFGRTGAVITVNSHLELLNVSMPRNYYQAGCRFKLYDPNTCQLNPASFGITTSLTQVGTGNFLTVGVTGVNPGGSGTLALGKVIFTSGANAGVGRLIRSWSASAQQFEMIAPLPFQPAVGDGCVLYPGCDKTTTQCTAFGNLANFGGMPFIPAPEAAA